MPPAEDPNKNPPPPKIPSYRVPPKDPHATLDPEDELAAAKRHLMDAARLVDPLKGMRARPFLSVGIAAGIGAILGSSNGKVSGAVSGTVKGGFGGVAKLLAVTAKHFT